MKLPPLDYLQDCLDYNHNTGILVWKTRPRDHFRTLVKRDLWNRIHAGFDAGYIYTYGLRLHIDGKTLPNHYVAWKLYTHKQTDRGSRERISPWIGHRNPVRADNRFKNLREFKTQKELRDTVPTASAYKPGTPIEVSDYELDGHPVWLVHAEFHIFNFHSDQQQALKTKSYLEERLL